MVDCVFCKIVAGSIPSLKVFEDESTIAIMDVANDVDGHILVMPKQHCENVLDCDETTLKSLITTVKNISNHLVDNCGYDGVNLLNASGKSAGQSVPHFHIHVIPRKIQDGIDAWPKFQGAILSAEEIYPKLVVR